MIPNYQTQRDKVFTPEGVNALLKINMDSWNYLARSGAFKASQVMSGDAWLVLNCLDVLVENKMLREVTPLGTAGQDRVFVR